MWKWSAEQGRYVDDETGAIMSPRRVRQLARASFMKGAQNIEPITRYYDRGWLSPDDWERLMREDIKASYIRQYLAGRGGRGQMTPADWGSIGGMLKEQYGWLRKFKGDLPDMEYSGIYSRSMMYISSSKEAYERAWQRAVDSDMPRMPMYPGQGRTRCLTNCACRWEYRAREDGGWDCSWKLGAAEHCEDCRANAAKWNPLSFPGTGRKTGRSQEVKDLVGTIRAQGRKARPEEKAFIEDMMTRIGEIHDVSLRPGSKPSYGAGIREMEFWLGTKDTMENEGSFSIKPFSGGRAQICIRTDGAHPWATLAHEMGHFLDNLVLGHGPSPASYGESPLMAKWLEAVLESDAVSRLGEASDDGVIRSQFTGEEYALDDDSQRYVDYLLGTNELWARAYAQWVAEKTGFDPLLDGVNETLSREYYSEAQWYDEDFAPIREAIDAIMVDFMK